MSKLLLKVLDAKQKSQPALLHPISLTYIRKLLAAFSRVTTPRLADRIDQETVQPLVESLSERELEVLQRIAAGMSNQEIAQEFVVSVGTIKTHINNLYGKLSVHSRTQAIVRARELHLL